MTISFSGLASGLDTSSWISSLTALKQAKVTSLQQEKTVIETKQSSLNTIKNIFSNFRSLVEKVTDARLNVASMNVFAQRIASSANLNVLTATATTEASEGKYEIKVDKLATNTSATSKYSYNTTIVETTKATNASLLRNMGITTGNIGVCVDGIERRVNITENDTIGSFIQKLGNVGVNASFNEDSGIFTADISLTDIHDLNLTGIVDCLVDKLHLKGVNEGYQTAQMQLENVDTEWNIATTDTQLSLLGVTTAGNNDNVTVNAFDHDYTVTITDNMTIGGFITALKSQNANIDASLSNDGIFTLNNAYITGDGTTGLLAALGLEDGQDAQICEITQASNQLSHNVTTTDIAIATIATKLVDIGTGTTMPENANVIVKNSNNEYTTINLNQNSTLGDLLTAMGNAGLSAQIDNDGIVSISGGTITGGTFNVAEVLGLSSEPYTARVTGNALTETIELFELVNLDTKIVDDLRVKEGYLKVTDSEGVDRYLKIYSGQTIQNLMSDLASMGIDATLDDEGVLSITGGAFETLSDTDVEYLYGNGSIMDDDRYMHGTDLLEKLYGSESIPLNMTSVASTRAKSRALRTTVTNTIMATTATTLGTLGLTQDNYNAVFNVRDENRTINISSTDTIADFMNKLQAAGIGSSFDEDTSRITIENSVISGSENLANILGLTTEVSGKYATSNAVYAHNTILAELTDKLSDFITLPTDKTVAVHDVDGNVIGTVTVTNSSTFESFFADLDEYGITGSIINGQISFTSNNGNYISGAVLGELGISTSTQTMIVTTTVGTTSSSTAAVTHTERELAGYDSKISDFITLPANKTITIKNSDDYDIATVTINGDTTFRQLFEALDNNGIIGTLSEGVISLTSNNGSYATGQVLTEFGMTTPVSYTTTVAVTKASSSALTYTHTEKATSADKISDFITLPDNKVITVKDNDQNTVGTVTIGANTTFDEMFTQLAALDVQGHIEDGVVKLSSSSGNYATGSVLTSLGISVTPTTVTSYVTTTSGTTSTSGLITYGSTDTATVTSTISTYITTLTSNTSLVVKNEAGTAIGTVTVGATTTFQQMFNALDDLGIQASISDGVVTMTSNNGSYVTGDFLAKLGMSAVTSTTVITTVTGDVQTSTAVVSYSTTTTAGTSSKISDYVTLTDSNRTITVKDTTNTAVGSIVVNANTTFDDLFTQLASYDIQASMNNGVITINKGDENYVTGAVLTSLGITTTTTTVQETVGSTSTSALIKYASTDTATVTSTIKTYVTDLADNTKLTVKDEVGNAIGTVTIGTTTTFQQMFNALDDLGIQASISDGVVTMTSNNGSYVTGDFLTKLGMSAVTTTTTYTTTIGNTQTSSAAVTYKSTTPVTQTSTAAMQATRVAQMSDQISVFTGTLTGDAAKIVVKNADNSAATTITTSGKTFGQVCDELTDAGVTATMDGGVISLSSTVGRYIEDLAASNGVLSKLGISSVAAGSESVTVAKTMTSSDVVRWNETQLANMSTNVKSAVDQWTTNASQTLTIRDADGNTITTVTTTTDDTFQTLFAKLDNYGIQATITDGVVTMTSNDGRYVQGTLLGWMNMDAVTTTVTGATVGNILQSSQLKYTHDVNATNYDYINTFTSVTAANRTITVTNSVGSVAATFTIGTDTTFQQLFDRLSTYGIQGTISDGVVMLTSNNGSYATGGILTAMGIGTVDTVTTVNVVYGTVISSSTALTYTTYATVALQQTSSVAMQATRVAQMSDQISVFTGTLTGDAAKIVVKNADNSAATTITTSGKTFGQVCDELTDAGVTATMDGGVISLSSTVGRYIEDLAASNGVLSKLGISSVAAGNESVTVAKTMTSSAQVKWNETQYATLDTKLVDCNAAYSGKVVAVVDSTTGRTVSSTMTTDGNTTFRSLFNFLSNRGIQGSLSDGVVTLTSNMDGYYVEGLSALGLGTTDVSDPIYVGKTLTSSTTVTHTVSHKAGYADKLSDTVTGFAGANKTITVTKMDGTSSTFTVDNNTTFDQLFAALDAKGIQGTINDGVVMLTSGNGSYATGAVLSAMGIGTTDTTVTLGWTTTYSTTYATHTISIAAGTVETGSVMNGTTSATYTEYAQIGDKISSYISSANGKVMTVTDDFGVTVGSVTIDNNTTFSTLFQNLSTLGVQGTIEDGRVMITSNNGSYVSGTLADALGIGTVNRTVIVGSTIVSGTGTATVTVTTTTTTGATMSSANALTYSRYANINDTIKSGFAAATWNGFNKTITVTKDDGTSAGTVTVTDGMTYKQLFEALDDKGIQGTMEDGVVALTSNNGSYATGAVLTGLGIGTVTYTAVVGSTIVPVDVTGNTSGSVTVSITETVTSNTNTNRLKINSYMNADAKMNELNSSFGTSANVVVQNGDSTITITAEANDSVNDVLTALAGAGVTGTISSGGVLTLQFEEGAYISSMDDALKNALGLGSATFGATTITHTMTNTVTVDVPVTVTVTTSATGTTTVTVSSSMVSSSPLTYNQTVGAARNSTDYVYVGSVTAATTLGQIAQLQGKDLSYNIYGVQFLSGHSYPFMVTSDGDSFNSNSTVQDVLNALNMYSGISASFSNGRITIDYQGTSSSPIPAYYLSGGIIDGLVGNASPHYAYVVYGQGYGTVYLSGGAYVDSWTSTLMTLSSTQYLNEDMTFAQMGMSSNQTVTVTRTDGTTHTMVVETTDKVDELMTFLAGCGIATRIQDRKFYIDASNEAYISGIGSGITTALKLPTSGYTTTQSAYYSDSTTLSELGVTSQQTVNINLANAISGTAISSVSGAYQAGSVYTISTVSDLEKLRNDVNNGVAHEGAIFVLTNDISGLYDWTAIGNSTNSFKGCFDGNGYTISNMSSNGGGDNRGLFGYAENATFKNVTITNGNLYGHDNRIGILLGYGRNVLIDNCYTDGNVGYGGSNPNNSAGGIAGLLYNSTVTNCYSKAKMYVTSWSGCLVGAINSSTIINCCTSPGLLSGATGTSGGLIGSVNGTNNVISDCISGFNGNSNHSGSLIGTIASSATCSITGCQAGSGVVIAGNYSYYPATTFTGTVPDPRNPVTHQSGTFSNEVISVSFNAGDSIGDVINTLNSYGLTADIHEGVITINSANGSYITSITPDLQNALNISAGYNNSYTTQTNTDFVTIDYTTTATGTGTATVTITTVTTTGTAVTGGTKTYDRAVQMSDAVNSTKNLDGVTGKTIVVKDYAGNPTASFTINTTTSFDTLFSILSNYDIQATMEDGRIMITSTNGHYIDTSSGSLFGALGSTTNQTSSIYSTVVPVNTSGSMSGSVTVTITNTVTSNTVSNQMNNLSAGIVGSTKLSDLKSDIGTTTITVNNQGVTRYVTLEASDTIDDMLSALGGMGISGIITGGKVYLQSSTGNRITAMSANLCTALGMSVGTYTTETTTHITEGTVNTTAEVIIKNTITSNKTTAIQSRTSSAIGSCTLADIGITANQSMTVALSTAGDPIYHTITFNTNDTINDMLTTLAGYGVSGNLDTDGKLHLDFDTGTYITGVSDGLKSKFGLANASGTSTTNITDPYYKEITALSEVTVTNHIVTSVLTSNTASSAQNTSYTTNLTGYSKLSDLGISSGTITVKNNGGTHTIDMANFADGTVDDVLTALAGYGISGSAFNGSITLAPSSDAYISGISSSLAGIFKLPSDNTGNALYNATTQTLHGNSISSSMTHVVNTTMTDTTTLASIGANADSNDTRKIVLSNGTTLTYGKTDTVGDVINGLRANGMDADIHNGKLTITSNNGNYIVSVADGLKNALKISSGADGSYVVHRNERFNTNSNVQQTVRTATSSSTLDNIYKVKTNGTVSMGATSMVININGVDNTLNVNQNWSIEDLTNQLAAYGVSGSFDASTGKYTVNCASGVYIKSATDKLANALSLTFGDGTGKSYLSSSNSGNIADSSTTMSQLGATGTGTITVVHNGTTSTITVEQNDTVDDVLSSLAGCGIVGSITNGTIRLEGSRGTYISGIDGGNLATAMKVSTGNNVSYTTIAEKTTVKAITTDSTKRQHKDNTFIADQTTALSYYTVSASSTVTVFNGTEDVSHAFASTDTIGSVLSWLNANGFSADINNGQITVSPIDGAYIKSSTNSFLSKLGITGAYSTKLADTTEGFNPNSSALDHVVNVTMTDTTTLESIGAEAVSNDTRKIVLSNGTTLTYGKTDTVGDVINGLRANGMDADIHNGKLTVTSNNGNYIVSVADGLKNALKISSGADGSYVVHRNERFNTNSNVQQTVRTATSSSTLNDIYKAKNGGTALTDTTMTININGADNTLTVKKDWSIEDLTNQLAAYGVAGSFDASTGKYTLSCASGTYIKTIDAKLANALNMTSTSSSYYSSSDINMTTDTKMSQIGVTSNQNITVVTNGTTHVVTVKSSDTVDDMLTTLSGYGISGSVTNGVLTLNATPDCYITGVDSTLAQKLKINGQTLNHTTTRTETTGYNTNSNIINRGTTLTVSGSATFAELSMAANGTITVVHNGTQSTVTVETGDTVDDMLTTLAGLGISGSITNGILSLSGSTDSYITGMSTNLQTALGSISTGMNNSYTTHGVTTGTYNNSNAQTRTDTITMSTSTTMSALNLTSNGNIKVNNNGHEYTVTVKTTDTVDDVLTSLAGYGISGSVAGGSLTLTPTEGSYITGIDSNVAAALKLKSAASNYNHTVTVATETTGYNTNSNIINRGTTLTVSGSATFAELSMAANGTITVVHNGTQSTVTVETGDTVDDMLTTLAGLGISGSITNGILSLSGSTDSYILGMSNNLKTALGSISTGLNNSYGTVISSTTTTTAAYTDSSTQTHKVTTTVDASTKFKDLNTTGVAGNSCTITVYNGTTTETIALNKESTVGDLINALNSKGFSADINNGVVTISSLGDAYIKGVNGNYMSCLNITGDYYQLVDAGHNISLSGTQDRTITVSMTTDSTFAELGFAAGDSGLINLVYEGQEYTVTVTADKTLDDIISTLGGYGISGSVTNGILTLTGTSNGYITSMSDNVRNDLKLRIGDGYTYTASSATTVSGFTNGSNIQTRTVVRAATSDMALTQLVSSTGASLGITSGQIYAYRDGTRNLVNINNNETIDTLSAKLSQYGITINMSSDGRLYFDGDNNSYLTTEGISSGNASNLLSVINVSNNWSTRYDSTSQNLQYNTTSNVAAKGTTKVMSLQNGEGESLGITGGTYDVVQNGVVKTETITEDTTVDDLIASLGTYGMIANLDNEGSMAVGAYNNTYLKTAGAPTRSNVVDVLFDQWDFTNIYTSNHIEVENTATVAITRTTKLADINDAEPAYREGILTVVHDGIQTNISIGADATVGSLLDELALYGFDATINTNGQVILRNSGNSRLEANTTNPATTNALAILGIGNEDWINTNAYESDIVEVVTIEDNDVAIDRNTGLSELGITTGEYYVYNNGVRYTALISSDETFGSFMDTLNSFGIQTSIVKDNVNDKSVLKLIGTGDTYVAASSSTTNASNIADIFENMSTSYNYEAELQTSTLVTTHTSVTEDTLLSEYRGLLGTSNLAEGNISVTVDDETVSMAIAANETFGSLMEKFRRLGLEATLADGVLTVQSGYKQMTINVANTSNLLSHIGLAYQEDLGGFTSSSVVCEQTTTTVENRTLSVANYADSETQMSLLNISSGSMAIYRDGRKATIQINSDDTFGRLQELVHQQFADVNIKFEDGYMTFYSTTEGVKVDVGSTTDTSNFVSICGMMNEGTGSVTSSRELYRVNGDSTLVNTGLFRKLADEDTSMKMLNITDGEFKISRNGVSATVTINTSDTIADLRNKIENKFSDVTISIEDGYLNLYSTTDGVSVGIGDSDSNSSNISTLYNLTSNGDGTVSSLRKLNQCITEGNFTIGDATFTVTSTTTLNNIIRQINASDDAKATAYWDSVDGHLVIKSRTSGASFINIEAGTSNFTDIMGYTESSWSGNTLTETRMKTDSQTIGTNAKFTINGTEYSSASNTIESSVSRIQGVTFNLKDVSDEAVTLTVEQDVETASNAVSEIVDAYNELIDNVDEAIAKGGDLSEQLTLKSIRNQLRSAMTGSLVNPGVYRNLDSIGITLQEASASNLNTKNISNLTFNKDKFISALRADTTSMQYLLVGTDTTRGILSNIENILENNAEMYFTSATNSYSKQVTRLNEKIEKANKAVERYRARLEAKFSAMDMLISKMQNQYSSFLKTS